MNFAPAPQQPVVIPKPTFTLEWATKKAGEKRDVDLAMLMYNTFGQLLQVCFDADEQAFSAITHSGDNRDGKEAATIDFTAMPANVQFVLVAVTVPPPPTTSGSGGKSAVSTTKEHLHDVFSDIVLHCAQFNYRCSLLQLVSSSPVPAATCHNFLPLICARLGNTPTFHIRPVNAIDNMPDSCGGLEHVWRIAEFVLQQCIDPVLWAEVPHSHVELLKLKKNETVRLPTKMPPPSGKKTLISTPSPAAVAFAPLRLIGLGWSPNARPGESFDVDLHAFTLDVDTKSVIDHVSYRDKRSGDGALQLSGDDRTGDGDDKADDEQLFVSLKHVNSKIDAIFIVVQIFTGQTFGRVSNEFCRAVDENGNEMVRFALDKEKKFENAQAAVMCVLRRDPTAKGKDGGAWVMNAIGEPITRNDVADDKTAYKTLVKFL